MFSRIHRSNIFVFIQRATSKLFNLVAFLFILAPGLAGIRFVQAKTIEAEKIPLQGFFSPQQQTPACPESGVFVLEEECSLSSGTYNYDSVTVESGGVLILQGNPEAGTGMTINTVDLTVETGGIITADGQGYAWNEGESGGPHA